MNKRKSGEADREMGETYVRKVTSWNLRNGAEL